MTRSNSRTQLGLLVESDTIESRYWYQFKFDIKPFYDDDSNSYLNGNINYSRHEHDHIDEQQRYKFINPVPPPALIKDPFQVSNYRDLPTAAIVGKRVYKLFHSKIMFFELDAHSSCSNWIQVSSSPCITALMRTCLPKLLSYEGRLYILGCKVDGGDDQWRTQALHQGDAQSSREGRMGCWDFAASAFSDDNKGGAPVSQFGVIFDPQTDSWDAIPMPDVDLIDQPRFSTAFIRGHLLLMLPERWILDDGSRKWRPLSPFVYSMHNRRWFNTDLPLNVPDIVSKLVEVEEESTVYWISNMGRIYAHNLNTRKTQFGPIIGLESTHFLNSLLDDEMDISLFHVMGDLFCLIYQDPLADSCTSDLHCLMTRVIKLKSSIYMIVIGCFCAPIFGSCCFRNSFVMP